MQKTWQTGFIICLLTNFYFGGLSQNIDSLESLFNFAQEDDRVEIGHQLIEHLLASDRLRAKQYHEVTFEVAKESQDYLTRAKAYFYANYFIRNEEEIDYEKGMSYLHTAQSIIEKEKQGQLEEEDIKLLLGILNSKGAIYYNTGKLEEAVPLYIQALEYAEQIGHTARIASINYNMGLIHYVQDNYAEAIKKLEWTYAFAQKHEIGNIKAGCLSMLGSTLKHLDSLDKARYYIAEAIQLATKENYEQMLHESLIGMGLVMEDLGHLDSAIHYLRLSLAEVQPGENPLLEAQQFLNLARIHNKLGEVDNARTYFRKFRKVNDALNRPELEYQYHADLAALHALENNYQKAYELMSHGYYALDSFSSEENKKIVMDLERQYETLQKEKLIADQAAQLERTTQQRNRWITLGLSLLLMSMLGYVVFQQRDQKKHLEIQIRDNQIMQLQQDNKILGLSSIIEGQEAERIRIAKDLHDGLGSILSSVKAHYGKVKEQIKVIKEEHLFDRADAMIDEAVDEVRRISQNMMPPVLMTSGLVEAVRSYLENEAFSHQLELSVDIRNIANDIDENKALFIYRIIQELTNNVIKHADAKEIQLQMLGLENQIQIIYEDDGKGFVYHPNSSTGVGLRSIRSRIDYLEGDLDIITNPGGGATFEITIPI